MVQCQYGTRLLVRDTQKFCQWHGIFYKCHLFVDLINLWELRIDNLVVLMQHILAQGWQQALRDFLEGAFDDLSMHLVYEVFKRDFDMFKYSFEEPANKMPIGEIDRDEIHAKLSGAQRRV